MKQRQYNPNKTTYILLLENDKKGQKIFGRKKRNFPSFSFVAQIE